jgi:putative addiction module component (TIGR02574 family)
LFVAPTDLFVRACLDSVIQREIPVTEEQLNELDRRFEEYRQDPDKVVTWEEAKARILSGRR